MPRNDRAILFLEYARHGTGSAALRTLTLKRTLTARLGGFQGRRKQVTNHPNRGNPGLTYPEARSLLGMLGDIDPAHFEGHGAAYEAAAKSGEEKLSALPKGAVMIVFSKFEIRQLLGAVGQMTDGNARSFDEWHSQTHGTQAQWDALIAAEKRLSAAL
jgi:hypothetical protein